MVKVNEQLSNGLIRLRIGRYGRAPDRARYLSLLQELGSIPCGELHADNVLVFEWQEAGLPVHWLYVVAKSSNIELGSSANAELHGER